MSHDETKDASMAVSEEEIRPRKINDVFLRLARDDAHTFFAEARRDTVACPACDGAGEHAFNKFGFDYQTCPACQTLFVNPRPAAEAFARYYVESPSSKYWASTLYKETAAARREKLWKPKARMVRTVLEQYGARAHKMIDVGGGYGLFAEEMEALTGQPVCVIEPAPHLASASREKGLEVIEKFLEDVQVPDLPHGAKAFVSFEMFEHLHTPAAFLAHMKQLMEPGDLFLFTTLSGMGVDIQVLWNESNSVFPPHHLNFLNPRSVRVLLERVGLETIEVTTPGKLDVDILVNHAALIKDRFWRTFVASATAQEKAQWQNLIAESGWSSHMMVVCRKA